LGEKGKKADAEREGGARRKSLRMIQVQKKMIEEIKLLINECVGKGGDNHV